MELVVGAADLRKERRPVVLVEGRVARQEDEEEDAEGPHVAGRRVAAARDDLGGQVVEGPDEPLALRGPRGVKELGEAKVRDDGLGGRVGRREENVLGSADAGSGGVREARQAIKEKGHTLDVAVDN